MTSNETTADGQVSERGLRRIGVLSLVGSSAEWFDYFLYAVASALVFPTLFFPNYDPSVGLLASFVALAAGYVSGRWVESSGATSATGSAARRRSSPRWAPWRPAAR